MNVLLKAAQRYGSLGWQVFPVKPRGKVPIIKGGFKAASVSPAQIEAWWGKWPNANIGVATGFASGLLVIDLDGPDALAAFKRLHSERSNQPLPPAAVVVTARGWHIYFAMGYGDPIRCSTGQDDEKGIDVRADGGYVLAPPSIHPSGHVYTWDLTLLDGTANPPLYSLVP
jgi:Bifunctional DNA primase/polymerase, N-terminal